MVKNEKHTLSNKKETPSIPLYLNSNFLKHAPYEI